ncbi:MAG: hypothetical protein GEU95_00145 [Rhizobiales bacterium]|nr:hypothetical protein [Hyphomicrobiales bacterium]
MNSQAEKARSVIDQAKGRAEYVIDKTKDGIDGAKPDRDIKQIGAQEVSTGAYPGCASIELG